MKENDYGLAGRVICCSSLVLLGWWLRGSLGPKVARQAGGTNAAQQTGGVTPPPTARFAFDAASAASAAPVTSAVPAARPDLGASAKRSASATVGFAEPPTLLKPYANHTAKASMLGHDPTLASQASAADLSKGSVLDAKG